MKKIRIYQLIYTFAVEAGGGGIGRFAIALSRALDKSRFEVTIGALFDVGTSYEVKWREELMQAGIGTYVASEYRAQKPYHSFRVAIQGLRDEIS